MEQFDVLQLPQELVLYLFTFMSAWEVCKMSQTSQDTKKLANDNTLWMHLVNKTEGVGPVRSNWKRNWKNYFREKLTLKKEGSMVWVELPPDMSKPCKRYSHTATNFEDKIVFIGGQDGHIRFNDVYFYDPETREFDLKHYKGEWRQIARHTAGSPDGNRIFVCGGHDGVTKFHKVSVLNCQTMTWSHPICKGDVPKDRSNATAAMVGNKLYYHGGSAPIVEMENEADEIYETFGDLHVLDTETLTWECLDSKVKGDIPCARSGHKFTAFGRYILLFGGGVWNKEWLASFSDLYILDTETLIWTKPKTHGISPNSSTFTIPYAIGSQLFVFAGAEASRNRVHGGTYQYDTVTMEWSEAKILGNKRSVRSLGTATVYKSKVFFFGGFCSGAVGTIDELQFFWTPTDDALM